MAVYSVEGKLGTGKTKFAVMQAQKALLENRRVASNVDLKTEILVLTKRTNYVRIPDKPTASDLESMGHGNPDTYDEDNNGILILDELGTWLNSRSFQDPARMPVIDWLIHARKHGWDVYLIVQDSGMIDKQVREALIEYQCRCVNLGKIRIPLVGKILSLFKDRWGYLPRIHSVTARTGYGANTVTADKWLFRGQDLHNAYDTRQIFTSSRKFGAHSVLPPWDFQPQKPPFALFIDSLVERVKQGKEPPKKRILKPKLPYVLAIQKTPADKRVQIMRRVAPVIWS